jgi:hypothetical protein
LVKNVTVDALVYLIVTMENMKISKSMKYEFRGNLPSDTKAEAVYVESGFMDYVQSKVKRLPNKSKMRIVSGTTNQPTVSKAVCDFVINELSLKRQEVLFIQKILVELMSNTYYHAYPEDKSNIMYSKWYIYAEHVDNKIRIIFADTGKGITGTIRKSLFERVKFITDDELLYLAFQKDNFIRSNTKLMHRGNGLPGIMDVVNESIIQSFCVFSGNGFLCVKNNNGKKELTKTRLSNKICGTIFTFDF